MSIIIKISDGLGNQLFQYACGLSVAMRLDKPLLLDTSWYSSTPNHYTQRNYLLDKLNISAKKATKKVIRRLKKPKFPILIHSLYYRWQYSLPSYKRRYYKESHFHFDSNIRQLNQNVYLEGFWQSENYFKNIREELLKEFKLKTPLSNAALAIKSVITSTPSVAIHIRRGDYTNRTQNSEHHLLPISYYYTAIQQINESVKQPHFFIFSDDIAWVQNNLAISQPVTYVSNTAQNELEDFELMKLCKHHIIANSSFSWWGAWLAERKNQHVIAPARWFAAHSPKTKNDIVPNRWMQL